MKERDYFVQACLSDNLQEFYQEWIKQKKDRKQFFDSIDGELVHHYWSPSNKCSETNEPLTKDNISISIGYWTPHLWKPVLKELEQGKQKNEAYDCQLIDMSCNDCKHLDRANKRCTKFDKVVKILPNTCQPENIDCFEHRKSY